jgi:hypothetical protein
MVDLGAQYQRIKTEIDSAMAEVIDSTQFIKGRQVKVFEELLAAYLGAGQVISCANGTDALQIAMMALDLQPGDEVITASFTYVATAEVMALLKLKPVLVSGAYNAGPNAVNRWLASRKLDDPQVWVETLPYYETRDYIPRVLAFTTIYDWRLHNTVRRVSSRMPRIESGTIANVVTTEVVCQAPSLASN